MKNIRKGDRVYLLYHMSNKGVVQEVYKVNATYGNANGPFSKVLRVKFVSDLDGKIYDVKHSELVKDE